MRPFLLLVVCAALVSGVESVPATTGVVPAAVIASVPSPLAPVKTDHPRDTMRSFMAAMDHHVAALDQDDPKADLWLADAVRCLDLSGMPAVGRDAAGRDAARHLKEVIDRVIRIDYERIPEDPAIQRWRLRGTEIAIHRSDAADRAGEHLVSPDTVARAREFWLKVRDLPLLEGAVGGGLRPPWQEAYVPEILRGGMLGIAWWQWILMGALIFVGLVMRQLVRFAGFLVRQATSRTPAGWDDDLVNALIGPVTHLGTTGVWFASIHLLGITGAAYTVIVFLIKAAFFINLAYLAYKLAGFTADLLIRRMRLRNPELNQGLLLLLGQTIRILALAFCLLLGAQNMGMDVASLIAGLGIGGLAFALAAKDTLANLFGSVMIMVDRPFRVGDFIIAKGVEGTVEDIGFRSTRVRTPANSLVSIPNSELVLANIDNLGMRDHRRVREVYSLEYGTAPERIDAFCAGVRAILAARPEVKQDAIVVNFSALGASSLDVLANYHLSAATWGDEMQIRHEILCAILHLAERVPVAFAFPTQVLHIASTPAAKPAAG